MPYTPVLIESLCRRPAGLNLIDMGDGTVYDFRDDGTGAQVALVTNPDHQRKLLSITEGFAFKGAGASEGLALPERDAAEIGGTGEAESPPVAPAPPKTLAEAAALLAAMGVTDPDAAALVFPHLYAAQIDKIAQTEAANAEREAAAKAAVPVEPAKLPEPKEPAGDLSVSEYPDLNGKTLAEIRTIYANEWGKPSSPRHGIETLVAKIESIRAERAKSPAN